MRISDWSSDVCSSDLPHLPAHLVSEGVLSDAQLESIIYAGEAHGGHLSGAWTVDATWDVVGAASDNAEGAVQFRRGWRSEEHTSELQSLMRISYAVFCLKKKRQNTTATRTAHA